MSSSLVIGNLVEEDNWTIPLQALVNTKIQDANMYMFDSNRTM